MAQKGYIKNSLTKDLGAPEMANMFQGIFGASGIMSLYENLACVKVDNNTVRMSSGAYNLSGHLLGIAKGTTEDLTIDSGTSGQNRNDLVVAEFVRNGGGLGVDTLHFAVVKGASTSGTAADPALTQQDINAAGITRQEALYRVKVVGTEITAVEKVAGSVSNLNLVQLKFPWKQVSPSGNNFTIPVPFADVNEYAFRVLGTDSGSFAFAIVPKALWLNDGTYSINVPVISGTGAFLGSKTFQVTAKNSSNHVVTMSGTAVGAAVCYR